MMEPFDPTFAKVRVHCPICDEFFDYAPWIDELRCPHCGYSSRNSAGPDSVTADQGHAEKAPATFEEAFDSIISDLRDLMIRKQRDYGHENITAFGEFGILVRLNDKVARLRNLLGKGREPQNESVEDSWRDIANYAIISLMLRRGIFTLPLAEEKTEGGCR